MVEAEGDPLGGKGTSAQPSKGKEPAQVVSSSEKTSTAVSSSSHGGGDGGDGEETLVRQVLLVNTINMIRMMSFL